jgi:hypothetical protein
MLSISSLNLPAIMETSLIWVCVIFATIVSSNGQNAIVSGPLILIICTVTILRALWVRHGLPASSKFLRIEALGAALVALAFVLIDFFVFMDGLGINPLLNVYFGLGPIGIALPVFVLIAIGFWAYGASLGALIESPTGSRSIEWIVLFFISTISGLIINSLLGNTGTGLVLAVIFGTLCLYKGVRDVRRIAPFNEQVSIEKE